MARLTKRLALLLAFLVLVGSGSVQAAAAPSDPLADFPGFVQGVMKDWQTPGVAVGIVKDGKVLLAQGFGVRDLDSMAPVTADTLFMTGSATKSFTATAFQSLVEEGRLDWDQPVRDYIPGFRVSDPFVSDRVTARDFAAHRTGLYPVDVPFFFNRNVDVAQLVANMRYLDSRYDFRTKYSYNNLGYVLLGHMIERAAGRPWADVVRQRILDPLDMNASLFSTDDMQKAADFAKPYAVRDGKPTETEYLEPASAGPAGGLISNVTDMLKWAQFQLSGTPRVISAQGLLETHSMQMVMGAQSGYGLGWMIEPYRGHTWVHHGGNVPGFNATVSLLPEERIGIVVLANDESPVGELVARNAMDRLLGLEPIDLNSQLLEMAKVHGVNQKPTAAPRTDAPSTHPLKSYTGEFANPLYGDLRIEATGDSLRARYYLATIPLTHLQYDQFTGPLGHGFPFEVPVRFEMDESGDINQVAVDFELTGKPVVFTRKPASNLLDPAFLAKLAGTYDLKGQPIAITLEQTGLTMTLPGQKPYTLVAEPGCFRVKEQPTVTLVFELDEAGEAAVKLTITQSGYPFEALRVK